MLLFRAERFLGVSRAAWVWGLALICVLVAVAPWIWIHWTNQGVRYDWMRGSSQFGIVCGAVGGWIIAFEMLYWVRKKWRGWPSNYMTRAEISGWPVGKTNSAVGFGRALFYLILSPLLMVWGACTGLMATVFSAPFFRPKYQRQLDGQMSRGRFGGLRERMLLKTQHTWLR